MKVILHKDREIKIGDIIIQANGQNITSDKAKDLSKYVKGEPGSKLNMKVIRNSGKDTVIFNLVREEINVKNISYYGFFPPESNNAYIKLSGFSRSASEELKKALKELGKDRNVESVILDLRGNPGGLLDVAVDISNKFLPSKTLIVSTRGRSSETEKKYYALQEPLMPDVKLVVLVNENSASASEIVAGAIQDNDRGVIIGEKTFGKGLVQTVTPLSFNSSLKITTAKYYTPSGRCIQKIDYSRKNGDSDSLLVEETKYYTHNNRQVFGSGGITPDSLVKFKIQGGLTKELLAKGIFFGFADEYYYKNPDLKFNLVKDEALLSAFQEYLDKESFKYVSEAEKQVDKLIKEIASTSLKNEFNGDLELMKQKIEKITASEMQIHKKEILREIKSELAARYLGTEGRIKEMLKTDDQLNSALLVLKNTNQYKKLLSSN
jgi:carboxyl-terminal processing protease